MAIRDIGCRRARKSIGQLVRPCSGPRSRAHAGCSRLCAGQGPGSDADSRSLAGLRVVQHPLVHAISLIYQQLGCDLGKLELCDGAPPPDAAVVAPPRSQRAAALAACGGRFPLAVTGWAIDPAWRWRLGVDYAVPLSDHADFDELIECIERVQPDDCLLHARPGRVCQSC